MKKTLAMLMALTLVISAIALPALAEENTITVNETTSATTQTARGGHGGKGQMPGQGGRNGQMPQMPNRNGQNVQPPQLPDQNSQNGQQLPGKIGRKGFRGGNDSVRTEKLEQWLSQLVTDGVITQEVSDAILAHVKAQADAAPAEEAAPALPDEAVPEESPEELLLKEMLESGVITQEQYDQYVARFSAPQAPEADTAGT